VVQYVCVVVRRCQLSPGTVTEPGENVSDRKPLPGNGSKEVAVDTSVCNGK
jgi:hypothetical protein